MGAVATLVNTHVLTGASLRAKCITVRGGEEDLTVLPRHALYPGTLGRSVGVTAPTPIQADRFRVLVALKHSRNRTDALSLRSGVDSAVVEFRYRVYPLHLVPRFVRLRAATRAGRRPERLWMASLPRRHSRCRLGARDAPGASGGVGACTGKTVPKYRDSTTCTGNPVHMYRKAGIVTEAGKRYR